MSIATKFKPAKRLPDTADATANPLGGCKAKFKAFAVLLKENTHGLYVMRELDLEVKENGKIVCNGFSDTVEDIFVNQLGKVEVGIEDSCIR